MSESRNQYCGNCFELFDAESARCPRCGSATQVLSYRGYQEKLLHALEHPLSEVRMRAIIALGLRGEAKAVDELIDCAMRTPTDVVQGLEIVRSLVAILSGNPDRSPLLRLASTHPAHAIQIAALNAFLGNAMSNHDKGMHEITPGKVPDGKNKPQGRDEGIE